jgi:hypothetical protein
MEPIFFYVTLILHETVLKYCRYLFVGRTVMGLLKQVKKDIQGSFGELKIDLILSKFTDEHNFTIRNLLLVRDNKSTQIDNVLFTRKKVYCIESKNYSGWIYGSEMGKSWTQTFNFYGKITRTSFYNPLTQNYGHIKYLSKFLDLPLTYFVNIVVFSNEAELKDIKIEKSYNHVVNHKDLKLLIKTIEDNSDEILDWEDLEKLKSSVNSLNQSGIINNIQHKNYVKNNNKKYRNK